MTKEWANFWVALAIMALAGAITANAAWGAQIQIGALAQWVSAFATFGAIWIALRNTRETLRETAQREAKKQLDADTAYIGAAWMLYGQSRDALSQIEKWAGTEKLPLKGLVALHRAIHLESILQGIDRMPLHLCPRPDLLSALINIRLAVNWVNQMLLDAISAGDPSSIDVEDEIELLEAARVTVENLYGSPWPEEDDLP